MLLNVVDTATPFACAAFGIAADFHSDRIAMDVAPSRDAPDAPSGPNEAAREAYRERAALAYLAEVRLSLRAREFAARARPHALSLLRRAAFFHGGAARPL